LRLLLKKVEALVTVLKRRAFEFKDTPQVGRTHAIHAEPTSFGLTFALWYDECSAIASGCESPRHGRGGENQRCGRAFALLDPSVEEKVCAKTRLESRAVSTQIVQRDSYAEYLCTLAVVASSLEKFALQVRHCNAPSARGAGKFPERPEGIQRDAA